MRLVLAAGLLVFLTACTSGPSPAERALLSVGNPRAVQVEADTQAILRGMEHARSESERLARLSH
jgi:hypothetical protein